MLRQLARTPSQSVSELSAPLPLGLPAVLKHIGVLVDAGLVERVKSGRVVTVTLRPEGMAEATAWLAKTEQFWASRLDRLAALVTNEVKEKR